MPTLDSFAQFPDRIHAGDSVSVKFSDSSYPRSGGWTASFSITGPTVETIALSDDPASPDGFILDLTSAITAPWTPGYAKWYLHVTLAGNRELALSGDFDVLADPTTATAGDERDFARIALANLEAALQKNADTLSYSIFGRSYTFKSTADMLRARDYYKREIARLDAEERAARGGSRRRVILGHFRGSY